MSRKVGQLGHVYAIEATAKTYRTLEYNIKYNQLNNVIASNLAITNTSGPVKISDNVGHHTENRVVLGNSEDFSIVEGFTIDQYIEMHGINFIDFMKINIEGAEKFVIQSFNKVKHIAISCHDFLGIRTGDTFYFTMDLVTEFLEKNNFEYYSRSTGVDYKDGWIYGLNKDLIN